MGDFMKGQKKIEEAVVSGYQKIEDTVVAGYKKVEDGFVSGYKKVEDSFVTAFLAPEATPPEQENRPGSKHQSQEKGGIL